MNKQTLYFYIPCVKLCVESAIISLCYINSCVYNNAFIQECILNRQPCQESQELLTKTYYRYNMDYIVNTIFFFI